MEQMQINGEVVDAFDITNNEDFPFADTWKKTYSAIEQSLGEFGDLTEKEKILEKVAGIVNVLVRYGSTYEDIVLETAQVYIFCKESQLNPNDFANVFGKYVILGANCLNQKLDSEEKMKQVFENAEMRYLGKIKIAEYILDLIFNGEDKEKLLFEIDTVLNKYKDRSHKGLIKILITECDKLWGEI